MKIKSPKLIDNGGYLDLMVEIDGIDHFVAFEQRLLDKGLVQVPTLSDKIKNRVIEVEGRKLKMGGLVKDGSLVSITREYLDILSLMVEPSKSVHFS